MPWIASDLLDRRMERRFPDVDHLETPMDFTIEGLRFVSTVLVLSALIGFFFTVGVWTFCKAFNWAPVNITINTTVHEDR